MDSPSISVELIHTLIEGLPLPVLMIRNDQIVFRNRAAEQTLSIRQNDTDLSTITGGDDLKMALDELIRSGQRHIEVQWPDNRMFNVSINQISAHGIIVALDDVTHLEEINTIKTQFVETVSHDLKNPLSRIRGFAKLLGSEDLSAKGQVNLTHIIQSVDHMVELIDDLLNLSQIEAGVSGPVEACDLVEIAQKVLNKFKLTLASKEMTLTTDLQPGLGVILADPIRLSQVVSNYVGNAIKYTPEQGHISVRISQVEDEISLAVSDTGRGIPQPAQVDLFQKFYRVPPSNPAEWVDGTGLGLSIVKAIAEDCGGRVWVESEVGVGSTFGCNLPIASEAGSD